MGYIQQCSSQKQWIYKDKYPQRTPKEEHHGVSSVARVGVYLVYDSFKFLKRSEMHNAHLNITRLKSVHKSMAENVKKVILRDNANST